MIDRGDGMIDRESSTVEAAAYLAQEADSVRFERDEPDPSDYMEPDARRDNPLGIGFSCPVCGMQKRRGEQLKVTRGGYAHAACVDGRRS